MRYLAAEAGIRQFLDIGTGLPTPATCTRSRRAIAPESRVVYVDNDPIVLSHARALLTSTPEGVTAYIDADLRGPDQILHHPATRDALDFTQPVALMLVAVLHFIPDEDQPRGIVSAPARTRCRRQLPGRVAYHRRAFPRGRPGRAGRAYSDRGLRGALRGPDEFAAPDLRGLDVVDPGVVLVSEWRPDAGTLRPMPRRSTRTAGWPGSARPGPAASAGVARKRLPGPAASGGRLGSAGRQGPRPQRGGQRRVQASHDIIGPQPRLGSRGPGGQPQDAARPAAVAARRSPGLRRPAAGAPGAGR